MSRGDRLRHTPANTWRRSLALRHLLYIVPTLLALWFLDAALSKDRYVGWERNSVRNSEQRWLANPEAPVAILGSSTSKDWLPEAFLADLLGVEPDDVLDAHINGCHEDCTYAEVRRFIQRGRRFEQVYFGTNLYQMCEFTHSKRVLQQTMMLPTTDIPRLFGIYLHADQPLLYMSRFLGITASGAYGDTEFLQQSAVRTLFGEPRLLAHRWYTTREPTLAPPVSCSYEPDDIAYKRALTEALLDDLGQISTRVVLILLPDPTLSDPSPEMKGRWAKHLALHQALAETRPFLKVIDLATDGVSDPTLYRDDIHLTPDGMIQQRALFERRMTEAGLKVAPPVGGR